jgi:hypothetical protein
VCDDLTTFRCRMSLKSGSLHLLEPSGPHRACYGTPLPLCNTNQRPTRIQDIIQRVNHTRRTAPGRPPPNVSQTHFRNETSREYFLSQEQTLRTISRGLPRDNLGKKGERKGSSGMTVGTRLLRRGVSNLSRYESYALLQHLLISQPAQSASN